MNDYEISVWDGITDSAYKAERKIITLPDFFALIRGYQYKIVIEKIRAEVDKTKRDELKKALLSAVTVSGVFRERRVSGLVKHSGYICIDFDGVSDVKVGQIKEKLREDKNVFGYFTSASGRGLAVIVRIDPLRHAESFLALEKYFYENYGLVADAGCKDVSRLRFVSYDPNAHTNFQANVFNKFPKEDKKPKKHYIDVPATNSDIGRIVNQALQKSVDITDGSYAEWQRLAASMATLGETGRDYFQALSQFHPKYDHAQTNRKFSNMIDTATGNITIGTFFYFAKRAGLDTNPEKPAKIVEVCREVKKNAKLTVENAIQRLQERNIICTAEDEVSNGEDVELVKRVFEKTDIAETIGIQEIEDFVMENYEFRRNEITDQVEWKDGNCLEDEDFAGIYLDTKKKYPKISKGDIIDIVHVKAQHYNPLKDFIESHRNLIVEGKTTGLIDKLAETICSDIDTENIFDVEYESHFIRKWLVGMIASIYGHTSPLLLALLGSQNTGKTFWLRNLLPADLARYCAQMKLSVEKDAEIAMTRYLVICDDELAGKSKMEEKHLKELTSKAVFTFRPPYGRVSIQRKRLAVLCGTSNEEKVLTDVTGNRRIISINVESINQDLYNSIDKTALFMEAVRLYETGEKWELTKEDVTRLGINTISNVAENYERELIERYFDVSEDCIGHKTFYTTSEIKDMIETKIKDKLSLRKIGLELRILNAQRIGKKVNGQVKWGYLLAKTSTHELSF